MNYKEAGDPEHEDPPCCHPETPRGTLEMGKKGEIINQKLDALSSQEAEEGDPQRKKLLQQTTIYRDQEDETE